MITINKKASIADTAVMFAKKKVPEAFTPAVTVDSTGGSLKVESNGPHNLLGDLIDAVKTLDDDPGNHKRKAIAGAMGTIGGALLTNKYLTKTLKEQTASKLKTVKPDPSNVSLVATLLSAATPAAIYYAVQNLDRPERAMAGSSVVAVGTHYANKHRKLIDAAETGISPEMRNQLLKSNASLALAAGSGLYTVHQLQAAADEAKLKAIGTSDMSDVEKAKEINRIRSRKDFLTRYPVFRPAPYVEKLRGLYNRFHEPEPKVSISDYNKYIKIK